VAFSFTASLASHVVELRSLISNFTPMSSSAIAQFDAYARDYDGPRHRLVPDLNAYYGSVADVLSFDYASADEFRVLDLGAGTGLLSAMVAPRFLRARFVLADGAPQMLAEAQQRFAGEARFDFLEHDFARDEIPPGFDCVISALAIHHLAPEELAPLFRRIFGALKVGGVFVNADQTLGVSPRLAEAFEAKWRENGRSNGSSEEEIQTAIERRKVDLHAPLEFQLSAMRGAGFEEVECVYKRFLFAVYAGWKPA